jgi:threonine synthase
MDIQISSNFERLLFEAYVRDGGAIRRLMANLNQSHAFMIDAQPLSRIREEFSARAVNEDSVVAEMAETYRTTGYVLDPHSAVGTRAGRALLNENPETPVVALSTAHPAKFPDAVERATGVRPALPPHMADLMERKESFTVLPNDQAAVERFIRERARAVKGGAA